MTVQLQSLKPGLWAYSIFLAPILFAPFGWTQQPALEIKVADVTAFPGEQNVVIPIYMSNYSDTVVAFQLWLLMDRPDIAVFQTDSQTVIDTTYWKCLEWDGPLCVDSELTNPLGEWDFIHVDTNETLIGNVDTVGTLCAGWEYVDSRSLSGMGFDLNIVGIADMPPPPLTPGIPPQEGGVLINMLADVFDIPDTMTNPTVNILISSQCFSDPDGNCIGEVVIDSVLDTTCFMCTVWADSVCLNWEETWPPPPEGCDSMAIEWEYFLDTTGVILYPGSITVVAPPPICGDINGDQIGPNVADLTYLVAYLFLGGPPPPMMEAANVNGIGNVNIADLTYLVAYLFQSGPTPVCW